MLAHPTESMLIRYHSDDLRPRPRERIRIHLTKCSRCRRYVRSLERISAATRKLYADSVPPDCLESILASYKAGERVILPTDGTGP